MQPLVAYHDSYFNEKEECCQEESKLFSKSGQRQIKLIDRVAPPDLDHASSVL